MATALRAAKEHLTCNLCKNNYEDPKTLVCLHSFCKKCISKHIVAEIEGKENVKDLSCPTCSKATSLSDFAQRKPEEWTDMLPTNEALVNILSALNIFENSSQTQCPQHFDKEVEFYCEEHEMFTCSLCTMEFHRGCRQVKTLVDAVQKRRENVSTLADNLSLQITETEKILNNRQDQMEIIESKENEIREEMAAMKAQINDFFIKMETNVLDVLAESKRKEAGDIQLEVNACHTIVSQARAAVDQMTRVGSVDNPSAFVNKYNKLLKEYEQRQDKLESLLKTMTDVHVKYISNREIEKILSETNNLGSVSILRVKGKLAKPREENVASREGQPSRLSLNQYDGGADKATKLTTGIEVARISPMKPMADMSVGTSPEPDETSNGTNEENRDNNQTEVPRLSLNSTRTTDIDTKSQRSSVTCSLVTARSAREFNIVASKEYECVIEGAAILSSGHIVLTDSQNKCLKVFDEKLSLIAMSKYSVTPGDVAAISNKEVVICLPETGRLKHQRIDIKNKRITAGEVLALDDKCFSVSFNGRKLVCCSSSSVYVYKRQGNSWVHEGSINAHVNNLKFIAIDKDAERIVVSRDGYPNRSIICMNTAGLRLWTFTHEEIRLPRGIVFCGTKVLVAASDQKTIVQLNGKSGKYEGVVYYDNALQWPWKLCISPKGDKMLVSQKHSKMVARDKNKILVLGLTKTTLPESESPPK